MTIGKTSILNLPFKALGDQTRRQIVLLLRDKDYLTSAQIAENFNITKTSVSNHISVLKQSLLVLNKRIGQNTYYCLNTALFKEVTNWFHSSAFTNVEDKAVL